MSSKTITLVDYGVGNLYSVERVLRYLGCKVFITDNPEKVSRAEYLILPGVGAFGEGIANLQKRGLVDPIKSFISSGRPFLGICLGMQLLMNHSEELGVYSGLNLISGKVVHLFNNKQGQRNHKIPHIGWNRLELADKETTWNNTILKGIRSEDFVYFAHSYVVVPDDARDIIALTRYGSNLYCSVIKKDNIYGCQFHPEKSGAVGLKIFGNFLTAN